MCSPPAGDRHDAAGPELSRLGRRCQEVLEARQQQDCSLLVCSVRTLDLCVTGVGAGGRAISASYYRRSISVLISLQSASAPLIRGNRWTRQGRGGAKRGPPAAQALTLRYLLTKHSGPPSTPAFRRLPPPGVPRRRSEQEGRV